MERIFWVECPECKARWYADWELRKSPNDLICPKCKKEFPADQASWLDDRDRP